MGEQMPRQATTTLARSLRQRATVAERELWSRLRRRQVAGLRFRRQVPIGPFVVDFLCLERRLIIEVDGDVHSHPSRIQSDILRERWLAGQGFKVLRLANSTVIDEPDAVLEAIAAALGPLTVAGVDTPHPRPFPRKGGRGRM